MTAAPVLPAHSNEAELPPHVRTAFGVAETEPQAVVWAGRHAWRCGDVLIRPVADNAMASWSAGVLDGLHVEGVRLARPVRASDGRWIVAGWAACRYVAGTLEPRYDAVVDAANRLHAATARGSPSPAAGRPGRPAHPLGGRRVRRDQADPRPGPRGRAVRPARGLPHADPGGRRRWCTPSCSAPCCSTGTGSPAVIDLVPCWRPKEWAAAVVVVDALAWGDADPALIQHWDRLSEWPQMLLRAVLHRLALHAQHPDGSAQTLAGLERAAGLVSTLL